MQILIDSQFNFKDIEFDFRDGTASQTKIQGVKNIERTSAGSSQPVTTTNPRELTISDSSIETVRVTVQFTQLQTFEDNGNNPVWTGRVSLPRHTVIIQHQQLYLIVLMKAFI